MKGKLVIQYDDKCKRIDYQFEEAICYDETSDYLVWITLPRGRKVNSTEIKLGLNKYLLRKLNGKAYQRDFPDRVEILQEAYSNNIDIFDNCSIVDIKAATEEELDSVMNLPAEKLVISDGEHPLTLEEVERLEAKYAGRKNIYVYTEENEAPVSLEDYRITVEEITSIANKIKSYGLSPLEAAIYAYDYARDRLYQKAKSNDYTDSRDLTKVLLSDEVVCVGYARIVNAILHKCGINSSLYKLNSAEEAHALNVVRITDEKYGIDEVFYIDATRGRKYNDTNNHFYSYKSFAMTRHDALGLGYYEDETFGPIDIDEYKRVVEALKTSKTHNSYIPTVCTNISNIIDFLDGKSVYDTPSPYLRKPVGTIEDAETKLNLMYELLCKQINPTTLITAIERVRRIEYYENPDKFPYSAKTIRKIGIMSAPLISYYPYSEEHLERMYQEHQDEYDQTKEGIDLIKVLKKVQKQKESKH